MMHSPLFSVIFNVTSTVRDNIAHILLSGKAASAESLLVHRITELSRLERTSPEAIWSNLLLKQGDPEQVAQDHIQTAFEDLQGRRHHNLLW